MAPGENYECSSAYGRGATLVATTLKDTVEVYTTITKSLRSSCAGFGGDRPFEPFWDLNVLESEGKPLAAAEEVEVERLSVGGMSEDVGDVVGADVDLDAVIVSVDGIWVMPHQAVSSGRIHLQTHGTCRGFHRGSDHIACERRGWPKQQR